MTITLNGWHRLWVLISCLYLILVAMYVVLKFPQPEDTSPASISIKQLSYKSLAFLTPQDEWRSTLYGRYLTMPNGEILSFKKDVTETQKSSVAKEYWSVVTSVTNKKRMAFVGYATLWWIIPCIAFYIFGCAIGWVYRGFHS